MSTKPVIALQVLASGSSGNATFVRLDELRLLIDAGISYRRLTRSLAEVGEHPGKLDAVLVTHEHIDHVYALPMLRKRHPDLTIVATTGTCQNLVSRRGWSLDLDTIASDQTLQLGDATVRAFATSHDVCDSVGYRIDWRGSSIGIATDLGHADPVVIEALSGCRLLVVEANHDPEMLQDGPYPAHLKRRIASRRGHLSNAQTRDLLSRVAGPELEHVVLAHLSEKNNASIFALNEVRTALREIPQVEITIAEQNQPIGMITLET